MSELAVIKALETFVGFDITELFSCYLALIVHEKRRNQVFDRTIISLDAAGIPVAPALLNTRPPSGE
jgi:hypothetical protein